MLPKDSSQFQSGYQLYDTFQYRLRSKGVETLEIETHNVQIRPYLTSTTRCEIKVEVPS